MLQVEFCDQSSFIACREQWTVITAYSVREAHTAAFHGLKNGWEAPVMGQEANVTPCLSASSPFVHAGRVPENEVSPIQDDVRRPPAPVTKVTGKPPNWRHIAHRGRTGDQGPRTFTPTALHRISADSIRIQIAQPIAHHFTWIFISKSRQP